MSAPLLRAQGISIERGGRSVVEGASIDLEAASIQTIEGPSGCGKSTFLRALAALIPARAGQIAFEGRTVREVGVLRYRQLVGYVPQAPSMFEGSVADNVRTGPLFRGVELTDREVDSRLARVGLDPQIGPRDAADLSGGERLRVALARALANEPRVLLVDVPTAALDPDAARVVLELLRRLADDGASILVVTHVEAHARRLGGVGYAMHAGVLARASG